MRPRRFIWSSSLVAACLSACAAPQPLPIPPPPPPPVAAEPQTVLALPAPEAEPVVAPTRPQRFPRGPTRWLGAYTCGQGLTRLELTLTRDPQTNNLTATFAFSAHPKNPGVPSGRFLLQGSYDGGAGAVTLTPDRWLEQPPRYGMVGLDGTLSPDGRTITGNVRTPPDLNPCTTFTLTLSKPGEPWPAEPEPLPEPPPKPLPPEPPPAVDRVLARVDGRDIRTLELDLHAQGTGLGRAAALDDLIDLILVQNAARARQLAVPPTPWSAEARTAVETQLATALGIKSLSQIDDMLVDHAWVKDAASARLQAEQRQSIARLRQLLLAGRGLEEAWKSLNLDGTRWHIAENEEYPAPVLPEGAQRLQAGDISEVLPGDGGLHLFKVHGRRPQPEALQARRQALLTRLRAAAEIEHLAEAEE